MAELSINEMTTYRWSFEQDVVNYRAAGIGAIGIWRQKLADFGEERGAELLANSGLAVSNLLWAGGFTGSEGHSYRESLKDAADALRLAATLKSNCLVVYSGPRNGHTQNHARRLFHDALRELLPLAADLDVALAVEPMHAGCAEEWTFLTNLSEAFALLETFDTPCLKLAFDTYHFGDEPRVFDLIRQLAGRIAIVHLGDRNQPPMDEQNRQRLGDGNLPLGAIVEALSENGYDGYYDVELIGEEIESSDYAELLKSAKRAFGELIRTPAR